MKNAKKILLIILLTIILSGCGKSAITEITYKDLEKKLQNKESFILEIVQDGCSNCENFSPKFDKILKKYELTAVSINQSKLSDIDSTKLKNLYNITGTPTVIFIENGEEPSILRRIVGDSEQDKVIEKLKKAGYIK